MIRREHEAIAGHVLAAGDAWPEGEPDERPAEQDEQPVEHGATLRPPSLSAGRTFAQLLALVFQRHDAARDAGSEEGSWCSRNGLGLSPNRRHLTVTLAQLDGLLLPEASDATTQC